MNFKDSENKIDQLFRTKLKDAEMQNPDHLWEGISRHLDGSRKVGPLGFRWLSAVLITVSILAAGALSAYYMYKTINTETKESPNLNSEKHDYSTLNLDNSNIYNNELESNTATNNINSSAGSTGFMADKMQSNFTTKNKNSQAPQFQNLSISQNNSNISSGSNSTESTLISEIADQSNSDLAYDASSLNAESRKIDNQNLEFLNSEVRLLSSAQSSNKSIRLNEIEGCYCVKQPFNKHFYIDAYISPEFSTRTLTTANRVNEAYLQERNKSEHFTGAYSAGLRASVGFMDKMVLSTGLNYSKINERFDQFLETKINFVVVKRPDGTNDTITTGSTDIFNSIYNSYKFIDIPLTIGYNLDLKDFVFNINAGIALNIMAKQSGKIYKSDLKQLMDLAGNGDGTDGIFKSKAGASLLGSFGLNYKLNNSIYLLFEPSFRYYLSDLNRSNYPINQKYLQTGFLLGARYKIR